MRAGIIQEIEIVEKPNVFDIESITIEHRKTATKLWKPIKQPKIITQQSSKIKVFINSKAADPTLQLNVIKRHILIKKS